MIYADQWVMPRRDSPMQILQRTAGAQSLSSYVRSVSEVNPLYAQLRDAAWAQMQSGAALDPRVLTSLDRARERPFQDKYVMVDAAAARLYMIQDGRIDPTFLITHRSENLDDGPGLYKTFRDKQDGCVKVVFHL